MDEHIIKAVDYILDFFDKRHVSYEFRGDDEHMIIDLKEYLKLTNEEYEGFTNGLPKFGFKHSTKWNYYDVYVDEYVKDQYVLEVFSVPNNWVYAVHVWKQLKQLKAEEVSGSE